MADFKKAIGPLLKREGGYVHDPSDKGGETYKGIARKFWPHWEGWAIIDAAKGLVKFTDELNALLAGKDSLQLLVVDFYKVHFWDVLSLDNEPSQMVGEKVFDIAVNQGVEAARVFYNYAKDEVGPP